MTVVAQTSVDSRWTFADDRCLRLIARHLLSLKMSNLFAVFSSKWLFAASFLRYDFRSLFTFSRCARRPSSDSLFVLDYMSTVLTHEADTPGVEPTPSGRMRSNSLHSQDDACLPQNIFIVICTCSRDVTHCIPVDTLFDAFTATPTANTHSSKNYF